MQNRCFSVTRRTLQEFTWEVAKWWHLSPLSTMNQLLLANELAKQQSSFIPPRNKTKKEIKVKTKCICSFSSLAWTMGPFVSNHGKAESSKQRQGLIYKFYLPKLGGKFQNFSIFSSRAPRRQKVRLQSQLGTGKITGKEMKLRLWKTTCTHTLEKAHL